MAQEEKKLNEDKLKSPLAPDKNEDPLKELNNKIDNLTSFLYLRQIEDHFNLIVDDLKERNRLSDQKIDELSKKIDYLIQLMNEKKDIYVSNNNQSRIKEEKQAIERITPQILDESDDEIKIEPLPEKEEVEEQIQTPKDEGKKEEVNETLEELAPLKEEVVEEQQEIPETMDINEGVKVIERGQVDDLVLSKATNYIKNKGDKLVINGINEEEKEEDKKSELEEEEERIKAAEEQEHLDLSRGDITEVTEEETLTDEVPTVEDAQDITPSEVQQVVAQESIEQPKLSDVVDEEIAPKIENTTKFIYENVKAVKNFVQDKVKTISSVFASNLEGDMSSMPQNMKQSWDDSLISMPEVLGPQHTR